jgi:hypothetical protein
LYLTRSGTAIYWNISSEEDISVSLIVPDSKTFSGTYLHAYKSMLSSVSSDERSIAIGLDPHTSTRVLENLAKNKTSWAGSVMDSLGGSLARYHVQESVAFNPSSPPDLLHTLELEKDIFIHLALASNKNTPTEILTNIAFSKNLKCDIKHSFGLSSDGYDKSYQNYLEFLYLSISHHPNTSDEVLQAILSKKIGTHSSRYTPISLIRSCNENLVRNTFSPAEAARYFYQKRCADRSSYRAAILAESIKSLNTFSRFFALLAIQDINTISSIVQQSTSWFDRYAIAQNPNTPKDILEKLAEDEHLFVRSAARSSLGLEVICLPVVENVEAIAIEENPQAIVATPTIKAIPIELKIERSMDLNPEDWLWATWRPRTPKPRLTVMPFDLEQARVALTNLYAEARNSKPQSRIKWSNAPISSSMTAEAAHFWFLAMSGGDTLGTAKLGDLTSIEACRQVIKFGGNVPPEIMLPIFNLFSSIEFIINLFETYNNGRETLYAARNITEGFRAYVLPYLNDIDVRSMQDSLRPILDPHQPRHWQSLYQIAACLGMHDELLNLQQIWKGQQGYNHPRYYFQGYPEHV